jgi:hypothetical protein
VTPRLDLLIPVGPGEAEPERARDAIESVLGYEPDVGAIVLVDDGPAPRDLVTLAAAGAPGAVSLRNPRAGRGEGVYGATCAGTTTGLRWLAEHGEAPLVLRLDSDALAIAAFCDEVERLLRDRPSVGIVGSYDFAPTRMPRDFGVWEATVRKLERRLWVYRRPPHGISRVHVAIGRTRAAAVRRQLRAALANGYTRGEHCLAAACVLTRELVRRLDGAGYLADPLAWLATWIPDDVMLGVQARAVGLELAGMTGDGEPFGVAQLQLPGSPEWLVAQGYSLIHPVKDRFGPGDEQSVRAFFRQRRLG